MKKFLQKKLKNEKGMTLIELLAVIVIIAIIAAIAIPAISNIIDNSRVGAIKSDAQNVMSASELYFLDYPSEDDVTLEKLVDEGYVEDIGSFEDPTTAGTISTVTVDKATPAVTGGTPVAAKGVSITGTGVVGKVQVEFAAAERNDIQAYANSFREASTNGTVTATKN